MINQRRGRFPVGMPIMRGPTDMIGALLGQQEMVLALMMEEPAVMPYGDRRAMVEDEWGNTWQIATHLGSGFGS